MTRPPFVRFADISPAGGIFPSRSPAALLSFPFSFLGLSTVKTAARFPGGGSIFSRQPDYTSAHRNSFINETIISKSFLSDDYKLQTGSVQ